MTNDSNSTPVDVHSTLPIRSWGVWDWVQVSVALAFAIIGVYLAATDRWAMGGFVICIGLTIVPLRWLGIVGGAGMLAMAALGWNLGRLPDLAALLIGVLGVVTIADRVRR